MAKLIKIVAILLVVLPALIAASACKLSVTSKLKESSNRYNVYTGTINNIGTATAADVLLEASVDLRSVSGLRDKGDNVYSLNSAQKKNGIVAGSSYDFTYSLSRNKNVVWTTSCTDGASSVPATTRPSSATTAPTTKPSSGTTAPTIKPSSGTTAPTTKPTTKPNSGTTAPTTKPTTKPATAAPTAKATTKPATTAPSAGGKVCPSGTWWAPAPQTTWQWQLTGTIDTSFDVQMYDVDLFDITAATVKSLHDQGRVVICYFSTQYENWRPDASSFPSASLGSNLDDWAGEKYVDIRSAAVRNVIKGRLDIAVTKGCDGVEPDNVDSYSASSGFPLTAANQLDFNRFLATESHARSLSVGLKNDLDQSNSLEPAFDWALNEQCKQYGECSMLNNFIAKGKAVFNAEYSGSGASVCPAMVTSKFSAIVKSLSLDASIKAQCCTYQSNGCAKASYRCVSSSSARDVEEDNIVYAAQALDAKELTTQEVPVAINSATTSFASIAFVVVAAVAALNL